MHVGSLVLVAISVDFISVAAIQLKMSSHVPSIDEVVSKSPHLLDIPDTSIIGRMISKSPSPMFPSFNCKDIQTCFGDEISALKAAILRNAQDTDDSSGTSDPAVHFGRSLKSATQAIDSLEGFFFTRRKTARHAVSALNYFLAAFYFARWKLPELSKSEIGDDQALKVLEVMTALLDRAAAIARSPKKKLESHDSMDWVNVVREYCRFTDSKKHWYTVWLIKHRDEKLYTVPVPNLGSTFLAIWALGHVALAKTDQQIINQLFSWKDKHGFQKQTIDYWKSFQSFMRKCRDTPERCEEEFHKKHGESYKKALTVSKAKYLVEHFAQAHSSFLFTNAKKLYEWLIDGANFSDDHTKNPFSIKA